MGKNSHGSYRHINGQPRNVAVHLTASELREMAAELRSARHTDGKDAEARRVDVVTKRRENRGG